MATAASQDLVSVDMEVNGARRMPGGGFQVELVPPGSMGGTAVPPGATAHPLAGHSVRMETAPTFGALIEVTYRLKTG